MRTSGGTAATPGWPGDEAPAPWGLWRLAAIYRAFVRSCMVRDLHFRANFIATLAVILAWSAYYLLTVKVIYLNTPQLAGWREPQMLVLAGSYLAIMGVHTTFFHENLVELPRAVQKGTFDLVLTKPLDAQFYATCRMVNFAFVARILAGLGLVAYAAAWAGIQPTAWGVASYLLLLGCGVLVIYSWYVALMSLAFLFVRVEHLGVALDAFLLVAKYPVGIFRGFARFFFSYVLPLALLGTVPAEALLGLLAPRGVAVAVALALGSFVGNRLVWRWMLRRYSSAGG